MKREYLIGLLGLTAILIPAGTSLLNINNYYSTNIVKEDVDNPIAKTFFNENNSNTTNKKLINDYTNGIIFANLFENNNLKTIFETQIENRNDFIKINDLLLETDYDELKLKFPIANEFITTSITNLNTLYTNEIDEWSYFESVTLQEDQITADSVVVDYIFKVGQDMEGDDLVFSSIELWDKTNDISLGFGDHTNFNVEDGNGSIEINNLSPDTTYNTELRATTTYNDGTFAENYTTDSDLAMEVSKFTTESGIVLEEVDTVNIDLTNGIMQVEGLITSNGAIIKEVNIIDTSIEDKQNQVIGTTSEINSSETTIPYSVATNKYDNNKINDYELQVVYELDKKEYTTSQDRKTLITENSTINHKDLSFLFPTKLGAGAIIGIITGVLIPLGIIVLIGWILYKKYEAKKISMQTKEQVKVAIEKQEQERKENKENKENYKD